MSTGAGVPTGAFVDAADPSEEGAGVPVDDDGAIVIETDAAVSSSVGAGVSLGGA